MLCTTLLVRPELPELGLCALAMPAKIAEQVSHVNAPRVNDFVTQRVITLAQGAKIILPRKPRLTDTRCEYRTRDIRCVERVACL